MAEIAMMDHRDHLGQALETSQMQKDAIGLNDAHGRYDDIQKRQSKETLDEADRLLKDCDFEMEM